MPVRHLKALVALALGSLMVAAVPAAGQTVWRTPSGQYAATLPPILRATEPDAGKTDTGVFSLTSGGEEVGYCFANVAKVDIIMSQKAWRTFLDGYSGDGEAFARRTAARNGQTFVAFGGRRDLSASDGWAGHFIWFETSTGPDAGKQTLINASTMLAEDARLVIVCGLAPGNRLTPTDLDVLHRFAASFRKL